MLIVFDGGVGVGRVLGKVLALRREPFADLLPTPDDRRGRPFQLRVLLDHRVDRVLVGDLRMLLFQIRNPQADETLPQVRQSTEKTHARGHPSLLYPVVAFGSCSLPGAPTTPATASFPN